MPRKARLIKGRTCREAETCVDYVEGLHSRTRTRAYFVTLRRATPQRKPNRRCDSVWMTKTHAMITTPFNWAG